MCQALVFAVGPVEGRRHHKTVWVNINPLLQDPHVSRCVNTTILDFIGVDLKALEQHRDSYRPISMGSWKHRGHFSSDLLLPPTRST